MILTMRARFSKGDNLRYISHLDLQRMFGRALRRSKIPVAYSQGFNPHPRLSFGSALGVGMTSESEFIDVELASPMSVDDFKDRMNEILPQGLSIEEVNLYENSPDQNKLKTLMSVINTAEYEILLYPADPLAYLDQLQQALQRIQTIEQWEVPRFSKKKEREVDVKPNIYSIECQNNENTVIIRALVKSGSEANVRPNEIMDVLYKLGEVTELPYQVHRKNLGIMDENGIKKPYHT